MGKTVSDFFEVTEKEMEIKKTVTREGKNGKKISSVETYMEKKNIVHVKSASDYIQHLIKLRGLDPKSAFVRIGMDGGGGSMKVLVSVFSPSETGDAPEGWVWNEECTMEEEGQEYMPMSDQEEIVAEEEDAGNTEMEEQDEQKGDENGESGDEENKEEEDEDEMKGEETEEEGKETEDEEEDDDDQKEKEEDDEDGARVEDNGAGVNEEEGWDMGRKKRRRGMSDTQTTKPFKVAKRPRNEKYKHSG